MARAEGARGRSSVGRDGFGALPAGTHLGLRGFQPGGQLTLGKGKTSRKQSKKNVPKHAKPWGEGVRGRKKKKNNFLF